jgi:hypothetical protein
MATVNKSFKGESMQVDETLGAAILRAASMLGNGNATTPMGAIEAHGLKSFEGAQYVSNSLDEVAHSLDGIANAIMYLADAIKEKNATD